MRIYCDFDGTIVTQDTFDSVLRELSLPGWERLEDAWIAGEISAAQCMREQVALIQGDDAALESVLLRAQLRPGFESFARWCDGQSLPLTIVSDGVTQLIRSILERHGLQHLPIIANHMSGTAGRRRLDQPWSSPACTGGSGVCKCSVVGADRRSTVVFVGDGRSDFCVAAQADVLFARGVLARHCVDHGIAFVPYDTFAEVQRYLFLMQMETLQPAGSHGLGTLEGIA